MNYLKVLLLILVSVPATAGVLPPQSKSDYCSHAVDSNYFINLALEPESRMAHENDGGLLRGGVCWWHSLFQRSGIYLSVFKPSLPKPTLGQARNIIYNLSHRKSVVEIPGYGNFHDFSSDWWSEIQLSLNKWQARDGFIYQRWIDNMSRKPNLPLDQLHQRMADLENEVEKKKRITWVMLKLPGIEAHAWLVLHVWSDQDKYLLTVIDSNMPGKTLKIIYYKGNGFISYGRHETVPYISRTQDFLKFESARSTYCGS